MSGSLYGAAEQQSRGAEEQQQPRSEPLGERLSAAAEIIINATQATPAEAETLARWIDHERRPRNLGGLIRALARGPDLASMLADQRDRAGRGDTAAAIAKARKGPPCPHGDPGGATPHPTTGLPLCPVCRRHTPTSEEDPDAPSAA